VSSHHHIVTSQISTFERAWNGAIWPTKWHVPVVEELNQGYAAIYRDLRVIYQELRVLNRD